MRDKLKNNSSKFITYNKQDVIDRYFTAVGTQNLDALSILFSIFFQHLYWISLFLTLRISFSSQDNIILGWFFSNIIRNIFSQINLLVLFDKLFSFCLWSRNNELSSMIKYEKLNWYKSFTGNIWHYIIVMNLSPGTTWETNDWIPLQFQVLIGLNSKSNADVLNNSCKQTFYCMKYFDFILNGKYSQFGWYFLFWSREYSITFNLFKIYKT